jgi:hypothetical protein
VVQVRLKGLRPASKAFHQRDFNDSWKDARQAAAAWGESKEQELRGLRQQGGVRADVGTLTWGGLVDEYLEDEATTRLAAFIDRQLHWRGGMSPVMNDVSDHGDRRDDHS